MAISLIDNLKIQNKKQNVERDSFATILDMVSYSPNYLPNIFHAMCEETGKMYVYNVNNDEDETLGKWRVLEGSGSGTAEVPIEKIKVNGELQTPVNKVVDITVPDAYDDTALVQRISDIESDYAKSSDIPSLSGYVTETWVNEQGFLTQHQDLSNYATKDEIPSLNGYATEDYVTEQISNIPSVDLTDYAKKNEIPDVSGYITEEQLLAKDYADKAYVTEEIAKASTGGEIDLSSYLSKVEATETYVTKESGKSLIADTEIERLASVDNYDDTDIRAELANKADITAIPTVDVTKSYVDTELAKKADTDHTHTTVNGHTVESDVPVDAKFTDTVYDDTDIKAEIAKKADATAIPSKVSDLENDSNFISSIPAEYVTETELNAKGYLTEHQDLSAYATKEEIPTVPSKVSELTNDSNYQTAEQVSSTVTTEIAKVVADAPEDFDTLKEMSDWIAGHEDDASAMNSAISDNKTAIASLQTDKADKSEIPTTVAELSDSADYAKKTDIPTTLPANGGNADTVNNHTVKSDVPENAVFTDTVYDDTDIKAEIAKKADATSTPHIDETTKNWFIGDVDTGILAEGTNGTDGTTYTPSIGEVTTVDSTELASATVSVNTETKEAVFNFAIPKGNKGLDGKDGVQISDNETVEDKTWSSKKTSDEIAKKVDKSYVDDNFATMDKVGDNIIVTPHTQIGAIYTITPNDLNRIDIDVTKSGYTCVGILSLQDNHGSYTQFRGWYVENNKVVIHVLSGETFSDYTILASLLYKKN